MAKKKTNTKKKGFTKAQLNEIKEKLIKEKMQILQGLDSIKSSSLNGSPKDNSGDLSGYSMHMADMATDLYDRELSLELAEGERSILISLNDAIKRIENGTYGKCDICGRDISRQRLKVMPQAKYCIEDQEKIEKYGSA